MMRFQCLFSQDVQRMEALCFYIFLCFDENMILHCTGIVFPATKQNYCDKSSSLGLMKGSIIFFVPKLSKKSIGYFSSAFLFALIS